MKTKNIIIGVMVMAAQLSEAATWVSLGNGGLNIKAAQKLEMSTAVYRDDPPQKEYGHVNDLAVFQNELYAAGYFDQAGGKPAKNIAKWNGTQWEALGAGADQPVHVLRVYKNELYVAGNFDSIGGKKIKNLAKWNGKEWSSVGEGFEGSLSMLVVHNDALLVGGGIYKVNGTEVTEKVAKWDGKTWSVLKGLPNDPYAMAVFNGELYAGGTFLAAGTDKPNLYKWDGKAWKGIASFDGAVSTMLSQDNELYVSGYFTNMNKKPMGGVAKFDGKKWSTVGNGLIHPQPRTTDYVSVFYPMNKEVLAGGTIAHLGEEKSVSAAAWDGKAWKKFAEGMTGHINTFVEYKGDLYAAGRFTTTDSMSLENYQYANIAKLKK